MVHTKMDLQTWLSGITAGEITFIDPPPEFYSNERWAQEELNECVDAIMKHESYTHDIAFHVGYKAAKLISLGIADFVFSVVSAAERSNPYLRLEATIIRGNPLTVEVPFSDDEANDRNKVETKIQWLTHMGCHLITKWYKDQLFAAAWKAMEDNADE